MAEIVAKWQYAFLAQRNIYNPLKTSAIYNNICNISVISHFGQEPMGSNYLLHSNKYVDFTFKNFNNKAALAAVINA